MNKRTFRPHRQPQAANPDYPQLEAFAPSRRQFLARLGAAVLGAGALGALAGCGDRPFSETPPPPGEPPLADAGVDLASQGIPDARLAPDIGEVEGGAAPLPDAGLDKGIDQGRPDSEVMLGDPALPDAGLDISPPDPGYAPLPDAAIDPDGWPLMGEAPFPDAGADET